MSLCGRRKGALEETEPDFWIAAVERRFRAEAGAWVLASERSVDEYGHRALRLRLHPAAGEVRLTTTLDGEVSFSATTSAVGPGYHAQLCRWLHAVSRAFRIAWDPPDPDGGTGDDTGYFFLADRRRLESVMLAWLRTTAEGILSCQDAGGTELQLSLDDAHVYARGDEVATPLGPRDRSWARTVVEDPRAGIDVFPWWVDGAGAPALLGSALASMWTDVRWTDPTTEAECFLLRHIAGSLERAFHEDAGLAYPWREWQEVLRLGGDPGATNRTLAEEIARRAGAVPAGPAVGYRRRTLGVRLPGGWRVDIPGRLAEIWSADGTTWMARDSGRQVQVTTYAAPGCSIRDLLDQRPPSGTETVEHLGLRVIGRGAVDRVLAPAAPGPDPRPSAGFWLLDGRSAVLGHLAVSLVQWEDESDREGSFAIWRSLDRVEPASSEIPTAPGTPS